MSKLNVGVGADFPVDSAEPEEDRDDYCGHHGSNGRYGYRRLYGRHRAPLLFIPLLSVVAFVALISLAIAYPGFVLAGVAIAILAFALRHHHRYGEYEETNDRGYDWRDRRDAGPQPDGPPDAAASGRS